MDGVGDDDIYKLADEIGDSDRLPHLARKLGFNRAKIDAFRKTNYNFGEVSFDGTRNLLFGWRDKTPLKRQREGLKKALEDAELGGIADRFFPDGTERHVETSIGKTAIIPHVETSIGKTAIIPCHVTFKPLRVSWTRQNDKGTDVLVDYQNESFDLAGDGRITMDSSFALNIGMVRESDAATYTCLVANEDGVESRSSTKLSVLDPWVDELLKKRREIAKYKVGSQTRYRLPADVITLGVFGSVAAGKSAFINSLKFAITGNYDKVADETAMTDHGGHAPGEFKLTESIEIIDNPGIFDFDCWCHGSVQDLFARVAGKHVHGPGGRLRCGTTIHCPIFVLKSIHTAQRLLDDDVGTILRNSRRKFTIITVIASASW